MIRPPFAARVVTGLIVTAIEETRKLPSTAVTLPMTAVSQTLQAGMRFQQGIAELAIKGDEVLDALFHRAQEEPEWATFDDDAPADVTHDPKSQPPTGSASTSGTATVTPITAAPTAAATTEDTATESATPGHIPTRPDEPTPADMPSEQADTVEPTPPTKPTRSPAKAPAKKAAAKKAPAAKAAP
ncbi:lipid droplet-associated protein, partial [Williamsia sp.]|uniref:lipid droplet-associated protein n=1 Tax=Williamsia sp. TaxID=1872085 RepID=UPI001A22D7C1